VSTLKESLTHRRIGDSPSDGICHSTDASAPTLSIHAESGELWVLPWSHFVSARHTADGSGERLALLFANHEVELHGARLASLMPEIAGFRLDSLRSLPAKYEPQGNAAEAFIERLSVRLIGAPPPAEIAPSS
jgi:hypothetical protein